SSVQEFTFDVPDHLLLEPEPAAPAPPVKIEEPVAPEPAVEVEEATVIQPEVAAPEPVADVEIEKADEWEDMVSVETETPAAPPEPEPVAVRKEAPFPAPPAQDPVAEKIQDIRFYISQEMWDAAKKAILDLTELAPDAPEITELISAVSSGQSRASRAAVTTPFMEPVQEIPVHVEIEPGPPAARAPEMPGAIEAEPEADIPEFAIETRSSAPPAAEPIAEIPVPIAPPPPPPPPVKIAPHKEVEVEIETPPVIEEPAPAKAAKPAAKPVVPPPAAKPAVPPPVAEPRVAQP